MLTMLASSETLSSSNATLLIFHIRSIEAETKIQISCLNRPFFKKILKDDKKKKINLKVLYHSVPFVFNSAIVSKILAADIFSTSPFSCASAW